MIDLTLGEVTYRIRAVRDRDGWSASAVRLDTGDRVGPDAAGVSEQDAVHKASHWLGWQYEHALALDALQQAERAYHRIVAGAVFAASDEATSESQRDALDAVDAARRTLDEVRGRRPL